MKKKGFTLIELLAVMVVLAILSLITVPIVLGAIRNARETSEERSFNLYIGAVRQGLLNYATANNKAVYEEVFTWNDFQDKYGPYIEGTNLKDIECANATVDKNGFFTFEQCSLNNEEEKNNNKTTLYGWNGNEIYTSKDNVEYYCEDSSYTYYNDDNLCKKEESIIEIGNVNRDLFINAADATMINKYLLDKIELSDNQLIAADINLDKEITEEDSKLIQEYLAGINDETNIGKKTCPNNLNFNDDKTMCIGEMRPKVRIIK